MTDDTIITRTTLSEVPGPIMAPTTVTPLTMIDKALTLGVAPEVLDKFMALYERWERGEARKAFDEALASAKAELTPIIKKRTASFELKSGAHTTYQYEDLAQIAEVIDPILGKHGLAYRHKALPMENGMITVVCILSHSRGHREEVALPGPLDTTGLKNPIQGVGSTVSYLQRYTVKLSLGVAAARDDDAQSASTADDPKLQAITADQYQELNDLLVKCNETEDRLLSIVGIKDPNRTMHDLTIKEYDKAKTLMLTAIAKREKNRAEARRELGEDDASGN